jgi:hypothetical protein
MAMAIANGFLSEALGSLRNRRLIGPLLALTLLLTASNIVIVLHKPEAGQISLPFMLAAAARLIGLLVIVVAMLRILGGSDRPPFRPDGALFLYALTMVLGIGVAIAVRAVSGGEPDAIGTLVISNLASTIVGAPFAAWFAAIAIERPLAWRPGPWMRRFGEWLPQLLLWSLLLVTPMALVHALLDIRLLAGAGDLFWPIALVDGPLSVLIAVVGLSLIATAYRRVARG